MYARSTTRINYLNPEKLLQLFVASADISIIIVAKDRRRSLAASRQKMPRKRARQVIAVVKQFMGGVAVMKYSSLVER